MYGIIKALVRIVMRRYTVSGIQNVAESGGAIYVCNHAGSYGPLAMGLYFPLFFRPWVIYRAMTPGLCRKQLEKDLFGGCPAILRPFSRLAAFVIEPACLWVMRRINAIPIYRGKSEIFTTFRQSCEALAEGCNIVIFPENEELEYNRQLRDFYTGFVHLARKFYKENGKALLFYPVYIDTKEMIINISKPVAYDPCTVFKNERDRLAGSIMQSIRQSAEKAELLTKVL